MSNNEPTTSDELSSLVSNHPHVAPAPAVAAVTVPKTVLLRAAAAGEQVGVGLCHNSLQVIRVDVRRPPVRGYGDFGRVSADLPQVVAGPGNTLDLVIRNS